MTILKAPFPDLPDAHLRYLPGFLKPRETQVLMDRLEQEVPWQQDPIRVFGKTYPQPRLTALYGEAGSSYGYSGIRMQPLPFTPALSELKDMVEAEAGCTFNICLLNLYRDGQDSNGWHADNEKELGTNPAIASLSLGASRWFHLKHRREAAHRYKVLLENGSLLLMQGAMQHHWLHQLPKTQKPLEARINLTFRKVV
ncbi:alpha-ketoglutarate-dependent dioxygenase AlkB [Robiginitalea sp. M366]|uniref:alpha-ketoglutarate-dependent dioxygenase AlkB family protein n=1 Tax=Robiginitalea aestuariiviva TaxID=3036903 RepID=UPI00240E8195|nr:alpha-ketoglutarate-dependent dioxygenase AlkB [Robiginitalea aestuariiviva]MDG1573188.1 alpha-ketoglutarate-dependent dioxygenase AlkB [Robiginitalea aestuariiviva]